MGEAAAFATSNCVSCGACVKECPTGALTEKTVLEKGIPTGTVRTTCAYCGVGCAFDAGVRDGRVVQMIPADDGPSNRGHACMKGRFGWTYNDAPDRLRVPLLRRGNDWEEISWESALDRVAQEFTRIKEKHGPDALATISSSRGTNEDNYLFGKFMRCVIGTNHIDNCARVCHSATVTGRPLPTKRGMKTPDMWDAANAGRLKGLWIIGYDVAQTDPNLKKVHEALRRVEFLVAQDLFLSETAKFAHLILPGASFLEKDGTFTNLERRIQRIRKAVEPPNGILPDWRVVCEVSNRMGYPMPYRHPSEIMDEIAKLTPMFAGVSYDRLDQYSRLQWPVPTAIHKGTALMHQETFPKGKARFVAVEYLPPGEAASKEYPFVLTTGRILQHYNCGAQTRRTDILELVDTDALEMYPADVEALHLRDSEIVRVVSARGDARLPVVGSERVMPGHLFTSFHFPASTVNALLSSSADESSKCPEYKVSAVRVEPIERDELDPEDEAELRHMRRQLIL